MEKKEAFETYYKEIFLTESKNFFDGMAETIKKDEPLVLADFLESFKVACGMVEGQKINFIQYSLLKTNFFNNDPIFLIEVLSGDNYETDIIAETPHSPLWAEEKTQAYFSRLKAEAKSYRMYIFETDIEKLFIPELEKLDLLIWVIFRALLVKGWAGFQKVLEGKNTSEEVALTFGGFRKPTKDVFVFDMREKTGEAI